jgi:F1F0 ATPase subunit 2
MVALSTVAGGILGGIFFGGLWWATRRGLAAGQPALWFSVSLLVRTGIVLAGVYVVGGGHAERLVACLVGFVMAQIAVTRWSRQPREGRSVRHAS